MDFDVPAQWFMQHTRINQHIRSRVSDPHYLLPRDITDSVRSQFVGKTVKDPKALGFGAWTFTG
jgi:hypothetical protein